MSIQEDSTQVVSEETGGNQETSQTTEVSETQAGNSLVGAALVEALDKDEVAKDLLRRRQQSTKDRGIVEAKKDAAKALSEVERLSARMTPENQEIFGQIRRDDAIDQLLITGQIGNSPQVSGTEQKVEAQTPTSSLDIVAALKNANYDLSKVTKKDLEFADGFKDQKALERALLGRNIDSPADPASIVQGSGGNLPLQAEKMSMEAATAKLDELRLEYAASKRPKKVQEEMDALDLRLAEGLKS